MATLDHSFCSLEHDARNLHVTLGRLVECRGNNLGIHAARHVSNLLGTLVDEQHYHINLGVVGSDCICNILEQQSLTGLGLRYDESTLTLADGREEVDHACRKVVVAAAAQCKFLFGEERSKVVERYTVAHKFGRHSVNLIHLYEGEIFLAVVCGAYGTLDNVAGLEAIMPYLILRNIYVVGRCKIVVVRRAQEAVVVGHNFENALYFENIGKVVGLTLLLFALGGSRLACCGSLLLFLTLTLFVARRLLFLHKFIYKLGRSLAIVHGKILDGNEYLLGGSLFCGRGLGSRLLGLCILGLAAALFGSRLLGLSILGCGSLNSGRSLCCLGCDRLLFLFFILGLATTFLGGLLLGLSILFAGSGSGGSLNSGRLGNLCLNNLAHRLLHLLGSYNSLFLDNLFFALLLSTFNIRLVKFHSLVACSSVHFAARLLSDAVATMVASVHSVLFLDNSRSTRLTVTESLFVENAVDEVLFAQRFCV